MNNLMPRDFTVYGIQRFGITLAGPQCEPLQENTEEFTAVSLANPIPPDISQHLLILGSWRLLSMPVSPFLKRLLAVKP
jgi:hypothetical protein